MKRNDLYTWPCNVCQAHNSNLDGECQFCECDGAECKRDNCSDPRHFENTPDSDVFVTCQHGTFRPACSCVRRASAQAGLLRELERLYEAARCMADPEHCLHASREHLPWRELAAQAQAAIRAAHDVQELAP